MNFIEFGEKKRTLSQIIIGLMRIDQMSPEEIATLIEGAMDEGVNAFDIADIYAGGKCESLLGEALSLRPGLREKMWIQSKCGIRNEGFTYFDFSKEHILEAVDQILTRLKTDHLDSLLLHRPDALMEPDEIAEAIEMLVKAGKIIDFGVSNMNPMMIDLLKKEVKTPIVVNQLQLSPAFTPSLDAGFHVNMKQDAGIVRDSSIFEYCRLHDMVIQAWSPLQYGYFEGVFLNSEKYADLNQVLDRLAEEKNVTPSAIAFAWILRYPGTMQAVTGTTKISRIREAAMATDVTISRKEWYEIYLAAGNDLP